MSDDKCAIYELPDNCTIGNAKILKEELLKLLDQKDSMELDFSKVDKIDLTGIQLLHAFKIAVEGKEKDFCLSGKINSGIYATLKNYSRSSKAVKCARLKKTF